MAYEISVDREALKRYDDNFMDDSQYNIGNVVLGPLKRAMIDAFVREKRFGGMFGHGAATFRIEDEYYKLNMGSDRATGRPVECWVVRPGTDGRGGGAHDDPPRYPADGKDVHAEFGDVPDYSGDFSDIRHWVNDQIDSWRGLPDPESFEELATAFGEVATHLKRDGGTLSGYVGDLGTQTSQPALAGGAIYAFRRMFVTHAPTVLNGLSGIATVLASYCQAQYGLWVAARVGLVQIIEKHTEVFDALSRHANARGVVVVRALEYVCTAANATNLSGALALAAETLTLVGIGSDGSSKNVDSSPGSFSAGKTSLCDALDALNDDVFEAEKKIRDAAYENILQISSSGGLDHRGKYHQNNRENYDVRLAPEDIQAVAEFRMVDPRLATDAGLIGDIVNGPMEDIATKLHELLRTTTDRHEDFSAFARRRDGQIGVGTYGPSWVLQELNEVLCDLLRDLKSEIEQGARQLWLACEALMNHDAEAAADLAVIGQELQDGSGYDPWDVQLPTSVPEGFLPGWAWQMEGKTGPSPSVEFEKDSNREIDEEPENYEWKPVDQ